MFNRTTTDDKPNSRVVQNLFLVLLVLLLEPKVPKYWPIAAKFGSSRDPASNGGVTFTSTKGDPLGLSGTGTSSYKVKK
jgi:hypothetical protein